MYMQYGACTFTCYACVAYTRQLVCLFIPVGHLQFISLPHWPDYVNRWGEGVVCFVCVCVYSSCGLCSGVVPDLMNEFLWIVE